jgi:hypothetical protein
VDEPPCRCVRPCSDLVEIMLGLAGSVGWRPSGGVVSACYRACAAVILHMQRSFPGCSPLASYGWRKADHVLPREVSSRHASPFTPHNIITRHNMTCQRTSPRNRIDSIRPTASEHRLHTMPG